MVKYPSMRVELMSVIRALSDIEYQQQAWINHNFPPGVEFDHFDISIDLLLEDMSMVEAPEKSLGTVLRNREELEAVQQVACAIDHMLKKLGSELPDAEYITDPDWLNVLRTAAKALIVLEKTD